MYNISLTADMDCNSKDLIYLIICSKCKMKYAGETTRKLKDILIIICPIYVYRKTPLFLSTLIAIRAVERLIFLIALIARLIILIAR